MGLLAQIEEKQKEVEQVKQEVLRKIERECKKYHNDTVTYLSKKPRIFTINFSDLRDNWKPEFYDFELQFKVILYELKHTNPDNMINKWESMKAKGLAKFLPDIVLDYNMENPYHVVTDDLKKDWYNTSYEVIYFHPKVIEFMDKIL